MQQQAPSLARSEQRLTFINHAPFLRIDSAAATALGSHIVYGAQIAHYGAKSLDLIWRPPLHLALEMRLNCESSKMK